MKNILTNISFFAIVFIVGILVSCTENIDIDLNSSEPQIVVEASVSTGTQTIVKLAESVNFDENNIFPNVENATVTITDESGNEEVLIETEKGVYISNLLGIIGETYYLNIIKDEKEINSFSTIPNQVAFKFMALVESNGSGGGPGGPGGGSTGEDSALDIIVQYDDPENETNFYRFLEYVNNE